jgi:hypothetical protein
MCTKGFGYFHYTFGIINDYLLHDIGEGACTRQTLELIQASFGDTFQK